MRIKRWLTRLLFGYENQDTWVGWRDGVLTVISDRWLTSDEVREHLSRYIVIGQPEGGTSTSVPTGQDRWAVRAGEGWVTSLGGPVGL